MRKPNIPLREFLHALKTQERQDRFAALAGTTLGNLRHLVTGRRHASSAAAIALEKAAERMRLKGLPPLSRTDLSAACASCEFARTCTERLD